MNMRKINLVGIILLSFIQCSNQPSTIDKGTDPIKLDNYLKYIKKPALIINLSSRTISVSDTVNIGADYLIVLSVHWPVIDSTVPFDSGWFSCHDSVNLSCNGNFRFDRKDTGGYFKYPQYLGIEYQYKNYKMFDTIFLDSIARFCTDMKLSTKLIKNKFEHTISWHSETIDNPPTMELKYMEIAIDNGLFNAEYFLSYPNIDTWEDGKPGFEGIRFWHLAFSPEDNNFNFKTEQDLLPFVRTDIHVKSYAEYDIRVKVSKDFREFK